MPIPTDHLPLVSVTLTQDTAYLTRFDERGQPLATYPVSASALGPCFQGLTTSQTVASGLLPPDVLAWATLPHGETVAIWLPPARRTIVFRDGRRTHTLTLPMPGFVFAGRGRNYWMLATTSRPTPTSGGLHLFTAPLPNIHPNGGICVGNVKFPKCAPGTIATAAGLFWESDFNHDLSADKIRGKLPLLKFFQSITGRRKFPHTALVPARITVGQWLKELTA